MQGRGSLFICESTYPLREERGASVGSTYAQFRAHELVLVYEVGHELVAREYLHLAGLDVLFGYSEGSGADLDYRSKASGRQIALPSSVASL